MAALSVSVTIMNGTTRSGRCLWALSSQTGPPPFEIIVPVFRKLDAAATLKREWPAVRFVEIPDEPPPAHGFQHWRYDRRGTVGVACARGDVIALTDECSIPPERWPAMIRDPHIASDAEVIGGNLRGKFELGRTFAGRRTQAAGIVRRISFAAAATILPPVLFGRKFLATLASRQRSRLVAFLAAAPLLAFCLIAWSAGEFAGYLTGRTFPHDIPLQPASIGA